MTRLPDWRRRLLAYLDAARGRPFAWGSHDCALFAAGAVEAQTGEDIGARWRGRYTTARGAARVLRAEGCDGLAAAAGASLAEIAPLAAGPGDVALVSGDHGEALGVVQGAAVYVVRPDGLGLVPLTAALRAWRV